MSAPASKVDAPRTRSVEKSATAFRTISEVSAELDVPQHVLRFWETKFPQVRPLKRGGGRRYYRPEDVSLLRHIQRLLYREGYTIKGVQRLLRETRGAVPMDRHPDDMPDPGELQHHEDGDAGSHDGEEAFAEAEDGAVAERDTLPADEPAMVVDKLRPSDNGPSDNGGSDAVASVPASPPVPMLSPEKRAAIEAVIAELMQLRTLLRRD